MNLRANNINFQLDDLDEREVQALKLLAEGQGKIVLSSTEGEATRLSEVFYNWWANYRLVDLEFDASGLGYNMNIQLLYKDLNLPVLRQWFEEHGVKINA